MNEGQGHSSVPPITGMQPPPSSSMAPPRIIKPASTAAPSSSSSTVLSSQQHAYSHRSRRDSSRSPRRARKPSPTSSSAERLSASPPDRLVGLSSQRQLRQLERLASWPSQPDAVVTQHHQAATTPMPISHIAAGKRPEIVAVDDAIVDSPDVNALLPSPPAAVAKAGTSSPQSASAPLAHPPPLDRGRSANVSPSRRWDRRGASATVLSGGSASGSGSGEESEITVGPSHQRRLAEHVDASSASSSTSTAAMTGPHRPSLSLQRPKSNTRGGTSRRSRGGAKMALEAGEKVKSDLSDLTSSDEEGAVASRDARSRRASLERDRLRGLQILLAAGKGGSAAGLSDEDLLHLASYEAAGSMSASTSTSATPTTTTDDFSERSSLLSRTSSYEASPVTSPIVAPTHVLPTTSRKARSRINSTEPGSAAFFGLADDEEEADRAFAPASTLSATALSNALSSTQRGSRSRSRGKSSDAGISSSPSPEKVRSVPGSRRPSHPESASLGPATSSSVPHRASAILGFAPISSTSPAAAHLATSPRRNSRKQAAMMMRSLSRSLGGSSNSAPGIDDIDLLSGSSVGSIEDMICIDQVEWAADAEEGGGRSRVATPIGKPRRGSLISVLRTGADEAPSTTMGNATVAAVEAKSLIGSEDEGSTGDTASSSPASSLLPKTPTASSVPSTSPSSGLSKSQERQSGFAVAYQERLSNLQSQLRLWANESNAAGGQPPSASSSEQQQQQAGLLASSWRQIARLPNLLFPASKTDKSSFQSGATSSQQDSSSASSTPVPGSTPTATPLASADSSAITLPGSSDTPSGSSNPSRRPSVGSRGVVDPLEGDRDPGAYITGLGHRIDPDVELSSVVHLQSFRLSPNSHSRGRSVDSRPASAAHRLSSHTSRHAERRTASDTEQLPALLSAHEGGAIDSEGEEERSSMLPALDLPPPATKIVTSKVKPQFTLHDDEDECDEDNQGAAGTAALKSASPAAAHVDSAPESAADVGSAPIRAKAVPQVDDEGFTTVVGRHSKSFSPRCSRPAAETPGPSPSHWAGGSYTSSEESDADLSRSTVETRDEDAARRTGGRRSRVVTASVDDRDEDDAAFDEDSLPPARGRRARGRGHGARSSSGRGNSPPAGLSRSRQCAIGLFSSKSGSRRADAEDSFAAAMKTVRSSPDLTYAGAAAIGRGLSGGQASGTRAGSQQRSSRSRTTSSNSPTGGREASKDDTPSSSSEDDTCRSRGRAGSIKVTSSSFAHSEHPPNSLPRSASASSLESMARRQSMMSAQALQTGTAGGPPPPTSPTLPIVMPSATTAHGGLMSSPAFGSPASSSSSPSLPSMLSRSAPTDAASSASGEDNGESSSSSSSSAPVLPPTPARPTLLSNSAHLLMLSLELEMMRAQKISAPLKVRWAKQRASSLPAPTASRGQQQIASSTCDDADEAAALEAAATDGPAPDAVAVHEAVEEAEQFNDVSTAEGAGVAPAYFYRYAYQPHRGSKLRNVVNA